MRQSIREFIEQWTTENVRAIEYMSVHFEDPRPEQYTARCIEAAQEVGISKSDLEAEVGSLTEYFAKAIDVAADREKTTRDPEKYT